VENRDETGRFIKGHKFPISLIMRNLFEKHPEKKIEYINRMREIGKSRKGKPRPLEVRQKISISNKGKPIKNNLGFTKGYDKRRCLKKIFLNTKIERLVKTELSKREINFLSNKFVLGANVDIILPEQKIAVFCDGDYWHNYPNGIPRDKEVSEILQKNGWLVLRYWEHEIIFNAETVVDEIEGCYLWETC